MAKPAHTSRAEQDLVDIWFEIAKHDSRAADRVIDQIEHSCDVLIRFPYGGEACPKIWARHSLVPVRQLHHYLPA